VTIGERLRELRKSKKMTLKQVGKHLGVTATTISCYETETRNPSHQMIQKLADLYDTTSDDIIGIHNENNTNFKTILSSHNLHWDGIPLHEEELDFIKRFLELRFKDDEKKDKDSNQTVG
jgi:transcriptional regulator with XRE-family HTH domain